MPTKLSPPLPSEVARKQLRDTTVAQAVEMLQRFGSPQQFNEAPQTAQQLYSTAQGEAQARPQVSPLDQILQRGKQTVASIFPVEELNRGEGLAAIGGPALVPEEIATRFATKLIPNMVQKQIGAVNAKLSSNLRLAADSAEAVLNKAMDEFVDIGYQRGFTEKSLPWEIEKDLEDSIGNAISKAIKEEISSRKLFSGPTTRKTEGGAKQALEYSDEGERAVAELEASEAVEKVEGSVGSSAVVGDMSSQTLRGKPGQQTLERMFARKTTIEGKSAKQALTELKPTFQPYARQNVYREQYGSYKNLANPVKEKLKDLPTLTPSKLIQARGFADPFHAQEFNTLSEQVKSLSHASPERAKIQARIAELNELRGGVTPTEIESRISTILGSLPPTHSARRLVGPAKDVFARDKTVGQAARSAKGQFKGPAGNIALGRLIKRASKDIYKHFGVDIPEF